MNANHKQRLAILAGILFFLLTATPIGFAQGASPTPTPSQEELALQEQKRLIELQRDIELAKKAIRDAQPQPAAKSTPAAPSATPLAGDTSLENVKLEAEMVSYKAMSSAVDAISKEIKATKGNAKNIAIFDAQTVKDWRFYQALFPAFEAQVNNIKNQYKSLLCTDPTVRVDVDPAFLGSIYCASGARDFMAAAGGFQEAFGAGSTLIKSFIDLAALIRTDTKIQGLSFTLDESAVVAELFRALKNEYGAANINLYNPKAFPPRIGDKSKTVATIGDLFIYKMHADDAIKTKASLKEAKAKALAKPAQEKAELEQKLAMFEELSKTLKDLRIALSQEGEPSARAELKKAITAVKVELAKLGETDATLKPKIAALAIITDPLEAAIKTLNSDIKRLNDLNDKFLALVNDYLKVDGNGGNALAAFIKAEDLDIAIHDNESYWLEIKSVSAGGNNRTRKNLLRFFSGAKVDHSGGLIIEYTLYAKTGAIVYSDKLSVYEGYVEPKKIRNSKSPFNIKDTVN